jgi:phosphoenolpyruvate synthase/pyruvate phosphate dikinase
MYGDVVLGVPMHDFEHLLSAKRLTAGVRTDAELSAEALQSLVGEYQALIKNVTGNAFPRDPRVQLWGAIEAVWKSWTLKKAVDYRRVNGIAETPGTAVNIVAMVFGNLGDDSGTGVAFTRDPSTGEKLFYGEFLVNAQGEDVVAGIRTPEPITADGAQAARGVRRAAAHAVPARAALPRHAGPRVHGRAREAVPAADAHRQAHGGGGGAHRAGHGERGAHLAPGGHRARPGAAARPAAAPA